MTANRADLDDAFDDLRRVVQRIITLRNPGVNAPYVQAFVIASEYTSVDMERDDQYGFSVITPPEQLVMATRGLSLSLYNYQCAGDQ